MVLRVAQHLLARLFRGEKVGPGPQFFIPHLNRDLGRFFQITMPVRFLAKA